MGTEGGWSNAAMWKSSTPGISIFSCGVFTENSALAHGAMFGQASFPKAAGGHRLQRAFCVKTGAEPPAWKFPATSCDWLVR